jgi:hypothetical protein
MVLFTPTHTRVAPGMRQSFDSGWSGALPKVDKRLESKRGRYIIPHRSIFCTDDSRVKGKSCFNKMSDTEILSDNLTKRLNYMNTNMMILVHPLSDNFVHYLSEFNVN